MHTDLGTKKDAPCVDLRNGKSKCCCCDLNIGHSFVGSHFAIDTCMDGVFRGCHSCGGAAVNRGFLSGDDDHCRDHDFNVDLDCHVKRLGTDIGGTTHDVGGSSIGNNNKRNNRNNNTG